MGGTLAERRVEAELLDRLAPDDPAAQASRRDLRRINLLMFQAHAMTGLLRTHLDAPPRRILDIGSGDGAFLLAVARKLRWRGAVELTMVDKVDLVAPERRQEFARLGWTLETVAADIFDWLAQAQSSPYDVVTTNLFLHHFRDADLLRLFAGLQGLAPRLLATEPRRSPLPLAATRALRWIGANHVTRHDATASVRAGFAAAELSSLWQSAGGQPLEEGRRGLFTHVFAGASRGTS